MVLIIFPIHNVYVSKKKWIIILFLKLFLFLIYFKFIFSIWKLCHFENIFVLNIFVVLGVVINITKRCKLFINLILLKLFLYLLLLVFIQFLSIKSMLLLLIRLFPTSHSKIIIKIPVINYIIYTIIIIKSTTLLFRFKLLFLIVIFTEIIINLKIIFDIFIIMWF
jgi:hypothetical protein